MNVELTNYAETIEYNSNDFLSLGFERRGACSKYFFSPWKAFLHSSFHWKFFPPLITLKIGRHLSVAFKMNQFNAARQPVRFCNFMGLLANHIFNKALIFSS